VHWDDERIVWVFRASRSAGTRPPIIFPGGEQQIVAVARAAGGDVRLLLLTSRSRDYRRRSPRSCSRRSIACADEIGLLIVDHHLDLALACPPTAP